MCTPWFEQSNYVVFLAVFKHYSISGGIVKRNMKCGISETVLKLSPGIQMMKRLFDNVFLLKFFSEVFNTTTIDTKI